MSFQTIYSINYDPYMMVPARSKYADSSGVARPSFLGGEANAEGARPSRGVQGESRVPEMQFQAFWG
jgi:hypothetical protein